MICGSCFNEQHHLARHDLHACDCDHPRCVSEYPDREADEEDRDRRAEFGFYDLSAPIEDFNEQLERLEQLGPLGAPPLYLHPSFGLR